MAKVQLSHARSLRGEIVPPGDKSISHRLVMLGALAEGESSFENFLAAEDCLSTVKAFEAMGIQAKLERKRHLRITGRGMSGLCKPKKELYLGNSGTTLRLLLGILAGQSFKARLTGDESLSRRPMRRVTGALRTMGAKIEGPDDANFPPLTIQGGPLKGIEYFNTLGSAQVKSAILLAGLFAEGETEVREVRFSRDHTERLLPLFGANFKKMDKRLVVRKTEKLTPQHLRIPGDFSSAAFFIVAAALVEGSDLMIRNVGLNPTRTKLIDALREMGAPVEVVRKTEEAEPAGDLRVRSSKLRGIRIKGEQVPELIDELPILMVAASFASGRTEIQGAGELRVKETDRIRSMTLGLSALGAKITELEDGCVIEGVQELRGGRLKSFGDHRTAMALAVAALRARDTVEIDDRECVKISYPNFFEDLKMVGSF